MFTSPFLIVPDLAAEHEFFKDKVVSTGVPILICQSMALFDDDHDVQLFGCDLLATLASSQLAPSSDQFQGPALSAVVCEALTKNKDDKPILLEALSFFANHASHSEAAQSWLRDAGALSLVCERLEIDGEDILNKGIQVLRMKAVGALASNNKTNQDLLVQAGALSRCKETLEKTERTEGDVVDICLNALSALLKKNQGSVNMAVAQRLHELAFAKISPDLSRAGQSSILDLITSMVREDNNLQDELGQVGACKFVVAVSLEEPSIPLRSLEAIITLAINDEENHERLMEAGVSSFLLRVMEQFPEALSVQREALRSIHVLASDDVNVVEDLMSTGVVAAIASSIERFSNDVELRSLGIKCLLLLLRENPGRSTEPMDPFIKRVMSETILTATPEVKESVCMALIAFSIPYSLEAYNAADINGELGLGAVLAKAMRTFSADSEVMILTAKLAQDICAADPELQRALCRSGLGKAVLDALQETTRLEVKTKLIALVKAFAWKDGNLEKELVELGTCGVLCHRLVEDVEQPGLILPIMSLLISLSWKNGEVQDFLGEEGIPEHLQTLIEQYPADKAIQTNARALLVSIAWDHKGNQEHMGEIGVAHLACSQTKEKEVALQNCRLIQALAVGNPTNQEHLGEAGACDFACSNFYAWADDEYMQDKCLQLISHLAFHHPANQKRLQESGACEIVCEVLGRATENLSLQLHGCSALNSIVWKNSEVQASLSQAGACPAMVNLLRRHPSHRDIQLYCWNAIATMSQKNLVSQQTFLQLGVAELLSGAFTAFLSDQDLQLYCMKAAVNLTNQNQEAQDVFAGAGLCEIICNSLSSNIGDNQTVIFGLSTVSNLCRKHEANQERLEKAKAPELMLEVIQVHRGTENILAYVLEALACLCWRCAANKRVLIQASGVAVVQELLDTYQSNELLQSRGELVLKYLQKAT